MRPKLINQFIFSNWLKNLNSGCRFSGEEALFVLTDLLKHNRLISSRLYSLQSVMVQVKRQKTDPDKLKRNLFKFET